jgi:hypothetical protein
MITINFFAIGAYLLHHIFEIAIIVLIIKATNLTFDYLNLTI